MIITCIPAFNEEEHIAKVVIKAQRHSDRVIVCDDGSQDMTAEIAAKMGAEVIRLKRNGGKGAALNALFKRALEMKPDVMVTLDGDGQHDPDLIPYLVRPILEGGADIVNGSRFITKTKTPQLRKIGNKVLDTFTSIIAGQKITDTQSGFRAYNRKAIESIEVEEAGIGVDSQLIINAARKELRITEVPMNMTYGSDTSTYHPVNHFLMVAGSLVRKVTKERPLLYLAAPGSGCILASITLLIYTLTLFNQTRYFSIPFAIGTIALLFVGSTLIMTALLLFAINDVLKKGKDKAIN